MNVSVVIPAYNVESTIGEVILSAFESEIVNEVIVVNNNSQDRTEQVALKSGATVINCKNQGLGYAVKTGIANTRNEVVFKIDGDIKNPNSRWIELLFSTLSEKVVFANGIYKSDYDEFPVGTLVALPALRIKYPELHYVKMPLAGTYVFRKNKFNFNTMPNNWAFDLALLVAAHQISGEIGQTEIGLLSDQPKKIAEYSDMAYDILSFVFNNGL